MNAPQPPNFKCDATQLSFEQLCELLEVLMRSNKFLTDQYQKLLAMKDEGAIAFAFGEAVSFAAGAAVTPGPWAVHGSTAVTFTAGGNTISAPAFPALFMLPQGATIVAAGTLFPVETPEAS